MRYSETNAMQFARLDDQYAKVNEYLATAADAAEQERRARWRPTAGISPEAYQQLIQPLRGQVFDMLGYPPPGEALLPNPDVERLGEDDDGTWFRVSMPLLREGFNANGIFIMPSAAALKPEKALAVVIHGGGGTPELAAGILQEDTNYHDMGRVMARRGHPVWMPGCFEQACIRELENAPDVHAILDRKARLVGTTLTALDIYAIIRSTEVMRRWSAREAAIAVGLSYGGLRSLLSAALSDQFVACISSCYFNDRRALLDQYAVDGRFTDWFFWDTLRVATDVEFCQLICPRPLCIEVGTNDDLFPASSAEQAAEEVRQVYQAVGAGDKFLFDAFTGTHEFSGVKALQFLDRLGL